VPAAEGAQEPAADRELAPNIFEQHEWEELRRSYMLVAEQELENWTDMSAVDEIDDIERYAEGMGVVLDRGELQATRRRVEERIEEAEEAAEYESDHGVEEEPEPESEADEIEVLFTRLADG
jgi:hypothetical protein